MQNINIHIAIALQRTLPTRPLTRPTPYSRAPLRITLPARRTPQRSHHRRNLPFFPSPLRFLPIHAPMFRLLCLPLPRLHLLPHGLAGTTFFHVVYVHFDGVSATIGAARLVPDLGDGGAATAEVFGDELAHDGGFVAEGVSEGDVVVDLVVVWRWMMW